MVHRSLDVVFEHLFKLAVALLLIPLAMGAIGFALDRTPTLGVRLWANRPIFTPNYATDRFSTYLWPSTIESNLLTELLSTDTFANRVLVSLDQDSLNWPPQRRDSVIADLRQNIQATPEGEHLFLITYRTFAIERGRTVLNNIVQAFGAEMAAIDTGTVSAAEKAVQAELNSAKQAMDNAIKQAETYRAQHSRTDVDPAYQTLLTQAQSLTDRYLSLQAQIGQIQQSESAVATLQSSFFRVTDPPAVLPQSIITKQSLTLRLGFGGLGAVLALEALIVYVTAKRVPGIRSPEDARRHLGLRPLGSVPPSGSG